jgi:hypothetical protein
MSGINAWLEQELWALDYYLQYWLLRVRMDANSRLHV